MGAWLKTTELQKPGNSLRPEPAVVYDEGAADEGSAQGFRSKIEQDEIRSVQRRMTAGAA